MDPLKKYHVDDFNHNVESFGVKPSTIRPEGHNFLYQKLLNIMGHIRNAFQQMLNVLRPLLRTRNSSNVENIQQVEQEEEFFDALDDFEDKTQLISDQPTIEQTEQEEEFFDALDDTESVKQSDTEQFTDYEVIDSRDINLPDKSYSFSDDQSVSDRMIEFSNSVNSLWGSMQKDEILDIFKDQMHDKNILKSMSLVSKLAKSGDVFNITKTEIGVLEKFKKMFKAGIPDNLLLIDVKMFYNVFMKCMNHAIKHDGRKAAEIANLENVFVPTVDNRNKKMSPMDYARIRTNKRLVKFAQILKKGMPELKHMTIDGEVDPALQRSIHCLVETAIGTIKPDNLLKLDNIATLKLLIDKVKNTLSKHSSKFTAQYLADISHIAHVMGAIPNKVFIDVKKQLDAQSTPEDFWEIVSKHGFQKQMLAAKAFIENVPKVLGGALSQFDVQYSLEEVFRY